MIMTGHTRESPCILHFPTGANTNATDLLALSLHRPLRPLRLEANIAQDPILVRRDCPVVQSSTLRRSYNSNYRHPMALAFALVASAAATAVAPPAAYACTTGSLNGAGSFLHVANLSVAAAKQWCTASAPCVGFTARMGAGNKTTPWAAACTTDGPELHQFYFKGGVSGTNADPSWRIWQKRNYTAPKFYCSGGDASTSASASGGSGDSGGRVVRGASTADLQAHASRSKCTLCPATDPTCRRVTYVDRDCLGLC